MQFVVVENDLFWDGSELQAGEGFCACLGELLVGVGECLIVGDDRAEVALVFGEGDFPVHSFNDFVVVNLLLNVEFGQFG